MDFNLHPLKDHSNMEEHNSAVIASSKLPILALDSAALPPLFVQESNTNKFPVSGMGSYFSFLQLQEFELQALIFRHMIASAAVPPELLHLVKRSLITSRDHISQYYPHHYQPSMLQSGHWGRAAMDPEPGRCRRTDGKKWRCSRDVVVGQKYCERHIHRGRSRSRKPVEIPTSYGGEAIKTGHSVARQGVNLLHPNHRSYICCHSDSIIDGNGGPFDAQEDNQTNSRMLRPFFDDWPKPLHDSSTALSISMPGNAASDFSLKLGTCGGDNNYIPNGCNVVIGERDELQLNWGMTGWGTIPAASMGGPLAEALR